MLIAREPVLALVLIGGFVAFAAARAWLARRERGWQWETEHEPAAIDAFRAAPSVDLERIREVDADFSAVLFEDFAFALYARAHEARGHAGGLDALAPYLSAAARTELAARSPSGVPVSGVVVGSMRPVLVELGAIGGRAAPSKLAWDAPSSAGAPDATGEVGPDDPAWAGQGSPGTAGRIVVELRFEANMTAGPRDGDRAYFVVERWRLERDATARSRPHREAWTFDCPGCGAAFQSAGDDRCAYCGERTGGGRFDWTVAGVTLERLESTPPTLTGEVEEVGTDAPSVYHRALAARWQALVGDDPAVTLEALGARLLIIYDELNASWTSGDLKRARPYVSDGLQQYLSYWVEAYRRQGLRNVLDGFRLQHWEVVKVVRDRRFDAVTLRIWGTGRDSTVRVATGQIVGGNPRRERAYSEYWTLVRGAGVRGAPRADRKCPNCGGDLAINMAGSCEFCQAHVVAGEFDWVLSKIEQDDVYAG